MGSKGGGLREVLTAQKEQPRVHVSPITFHRGGHRGVHRGQKKEKKRESKIGGWCRGWGGGTAESSHVGEKGGLILGMMGVIGVIGGYPPPGGGMTSNKVDAP